MVSRSPEAYCWKKAKSSEVAKTGFRGGIDVDGSPIYVGRIKHSSGDLLPGSVVPSRNVARAAYAGRAHSKNKFEILVPNKTQFEWVPSHDGEILPTMVIGGETDVGENLYIGRVHHRASQTVGKIHPSHGVCYIPCEGNEIMYQIYEALITKP